MSRTVCPTVQPNAALSALPRPEWALPIERQEPVVHESALQSTAISWPGEYLVAVFSRLDELKSGRTASSCRKVSLATGERLQSLSDSLVFSASTFYLLAYLKESF